MTWHYVAYGMHLAVNHPIPDLFETTQSEHLSTDVQIWIGETPTKLNAHSPRWHAQSRFVPRGGILKVLGLANEPYYQLYYTDIAHFIVHESGRELWVTWDPSVELIDVIPLLIGPVLGFILRLRGTIPLHASAIAVEDRAISIVGQARAGKSTLAGLFAREGHAIISDDITTLYERGSHVEVCPGYPRLRLFTGAGELLYGRSDILRPMGGVWEKQYLDLDNRQARFMDRPLSLLAVYLVDSLSNDQHSISPLQPKEALLGLISNTFMSHLQDTSMRAHEFEVLCRLVEHIPVRRITRHLELHMLPTLYELIMSDLQTSDL